MSSDAQSPAPPFVRESGARNEAVAASMQDARERKVCPFCEIVAGNKSDQPILLTWSGWVVVECASPEEFSGHHFLVISRDHPPSGHYDDLEPRIRYNRESVIQQIAERIGGLRDWGYSVVERRGYDGRHTAATVYHPCFHLIASDGLPVADEQIDPEHHAILDHYALELLASFRTKHPMRATRVEAEGGAEALLSEALKDFVRSVNLRRSILDGKAGPIWVKLSNLAD